MNNGIGKVRNISRIQEFEWRIENFCSLGGRKNSCSKSPPFSFAGESWTLCIYPNGFESNESVGYIGIYLFRESSGFPTSQDYTLILKTEKEEIHEEDECTFVFKDEIGYGVAKMFNRSEFFTKKRQLGLSDVVIVICRMKHAGSTDEASANETATSSNNEKISVATNTSFHEIKDEAIKCPVCCYDIKVKDLNDHQCLKSNIKAVEKLSLDLKEMMESGDNSDTVVKVKGEVFQLHRNVLMARNTYFHSMFNSDMKEKKTGTVTIDDCEPDIFRVLVRYMYTGKVDKLSPENVCKLYEVTDKYQEDELKRECLDFMMETISEDSFCDYITLALKYDERKLFEKTVEFFISKPKDIVKSVKWQNFAIQYPTHANELIIKTLDHLVK